VFLDIPFFFEELDMPILIQSLNQEKQELPEVLMCSTLCFLEKKQQQKTLSF